MLTTAVGALGGEALDVRALGLDVAFPASFLALMGPALRTPTGRRVGLVAGVVAVALTPLLPAGLPILVAGLVAVPVGLRRTGTDA